MKFAVFSVTALFAMVVANEHPGNLRGPSSKVSEAEPGNLGDAFHGGESGRNLQPAVPCGFGNVGNGVCPDGNCCSPFGWCGVTAAHCSDGGTCGGGNVGDGLCADRSLCCSPYGWCGSSELHCGAAEPGSNTAENPVAPPAPTGTCGGGSRGDGICADGLCCSQYGWCGTSEAHCAGTNDAPAPVEEEPPAPPVTNPPPTNGASDSSTPVANDFGTCGGGSRGNGVCADGTCCSQYGWCGTSSAHCDGNQPPSGSDGDAGNSPSDSNVNVPPKTLTISDLQAALDAYNSFWGESIQANQGLVDLINTVTTVPNRGWSLYRQVAFVAQTIWESGAFQYTEEIAATTPPYSTKWSYQDCDWNTPGWQTPPNGKPFFGRGYIQLSWCANYKAYGSNRMVNNDPDFFYKNPELVATPTYAMDSAAWFFENRVYDNSGRFGDTTNDINGVQECTGYGGGKPQKRYEIFEAMAKEVGLSGYSESGCYN